jgi:transposase
LKISLKIIDAIKRNDAYFHFHFRECNAIKLVMEVFQDQLRFYSFVRMKLGDSAKEIHRQLTAVFEESACSYSSVENWCKEFKEGKRTSFEDKPRCGAPTSSRTCDLEEETNIPHTTIHRILTEDLRLRNVCSVWIPHLLSPQNKEDRVKSAKHIRRMLLPLARHQFDSLAVEDETYVNFDPCHTKSENRTWITQGAPRHQVARPHLTPRKTLLVTVISPGLRYNVKALPRGSTLDSSGYIEFMRETGNKWRSLRSNPIHLNEVLWMHDNARPHTSAAVRQFMETRDMKTVWQSPYSPDYNLCDRWVFSNMKSHLRQQTFNDEKEVEIAALQYLRQVDKDTIIREVNLLLQHCQLVIENHGEYITH